MFKKTQTFGFYTISIENMTYISMFLIYTMKRDNPIMPLIYFYYTYICNILFLIMLVHIWQKKMKLFSTIQWWSFIICLTRSNYCYPAGLHRMLVCSFSYDSRIFFAYGDITITGEGLQILTLTRHSWLLSNIKSGIEKTAIYFSEIILGQVLMLYYVLRFVLLCYLDINMSPILCILDFDKRNLVEIQFKPCNKTSKI